MKTALPLISVPFAPTNVRDRNGKRLAPDNHVDNCLLCNRPLSASNIACFVEMTTSCKVVPVGARVPNSQGCFPVGSSCKHLVPEEYRITKKKDPTLWEQF